MIERERGARKSKIEEEVSRRSTCQKMELSIALPSHFASIVVLDNASIKMRQSELKLIKRYVGYQRAYIYTDLHDWPIHLTETYT